MLGMDVNCVQILASTSLFDRNKWNIHWDDIFFLCFNMLRNNLRSVVFWMKWNGK